MSFRKSRHTKIEYELSDWDAAPPTMRKRSNSMDLLDALRRSSKKFHSRSHTAVARFPEHYCGDEYVATLTNTAPNTTYANSYRYSKEAKVRQCHDWNTKASTASRGSQCNLKGNLVDSYVQCNPATREMTVQTHKWRPDVVAVQEHKTPTPPKPTPQPPGFDMEALVALIVARVNPECKGSQISEDILHSISASIAELLSLLHSVRRTTEGVDVKADMTLEELRKLLGSRESGISEELLVMLSKIHDYQGALADQILKVVSQLKEEHSHIIRTMRTLDVGSGGMEREYYLKISAMLEEILNCLKEEVVVTTVTRRELYGGKCRCAKIAQSAKALLATNGSVTPGICQRCVNDKKGHTFIVSLRLPLTLSETTVNVFGRMIECIENDDDFNMKHLLLELEDDLPSEWECKLYQVIYEALLLLALLRQSTKCSQSLAGLVDVNMMLSSMSRENHKYQLPNYLRLAVESRDVETLRKLFEKMPENERIAVINHGVVMSDGSTVCPLFEAARNGDAETFSFLIQSGASMDVKEIDRTILHEIAKISKEKLESPKHKDWNKALVGMLGVIFEHAGYWWERQVINEAWSGCTEASVKNALTYLFSIADRNGSNALQYAARYASPEIIKKMVYTEPYEFNPDPLDFGHDNGCKGYVVDQIESRLARKDTSVLERMIRRDPADGASVLSIEPFRTMIQDKWRRYRYFYGLWFVCYLCFMAIYSACAMERPVGAKSIPEMYTTRDDYGRLAGEIFILVCLPMFFYGEIRDGVRIGFVIPRPWLRTGLFRITNFIFVATTVAVVILRLTLNPNEDVALSLALLIGWLNALEFLGAWKSIGMFVIVLHKVFTTDIALKFALVFGISLAGTSTATYIIYQTSPAQPIAEYTNETFWMTPYTLTKLSMTLFTDDPALEAANNGFAVALYITFLFLFNFMLFGLVIGMFADTYSTTKKRISSSWIWVTATYALLMDRRLPNFLSITYSTDSQSQTWSGVSTKLKYLTRTVRRMEIDGRLVNTIQHVVLLEKEDIPRPKSLKYRDTEIVLSKLETPRE